MKKKIEKEGLQFELFEDGTVKVSDEDVSSFDKKNTFDLKSCAKKVIVSENVHLLPEQTFMNCNQLSEIIIASKNIEIQRLAFWFCYNVKSLTILGKTKIDIWGIKDCGVENVFIPENLQLIEEDYTNCYRDSFHCFKKLFRYKIDSEGRLYITVFKCEKGEIEHIDAKIEVTYRMGKSTNVFIDDYYCNNQVESEENRNQVQYLLKILSEYGRI